MIRFADADKMRCPEGSCAILSRPPDIHAVINTDFLPEPSGFGQVSRIGIKRFVPFPNSFVVLNRGRVDGPQLRVSYRRPLNNFIQQLNSDCPLAQFDIFGTSPANAAGSMFQPLAISHPPQLNGVRSSSRVGRSRYDLVTLKLTRNRIRCGDDMSDSRLISHLVNQGG